MWDMHNEGGAGSVADADIDAPEAWDITTGGLTALGEEIVVAVIDGGVDINHEDLVDNIWVNENEIPGNGIDDDNNGYVDDVNGWDAYSNDSSIPSNNHGTHVSGTIGAKGDNSTDVVGVNWDVKIMAIAGSTSSTSVVSIAYGYVLDQKSLYLESDGEFGANVVATNSSFGIDYANCNSGQYPVWNDLYNSMGEVGILSAAATINGNQNVDNIGDVPTGCSSEYMVSVTNTNRMDEKYGNAGYGAETIDLGAPGTSICSTVNGNGVSCSYTGTSMATPHVAGAIGLLHSAASQEIAQQYKDDPAGTAIFIRDTMFETVDILPSLESITVSGGRLNIYNAASVLSEENESYLSGDLNNDGTINVQDIVILVNFVVIIDSPSSLEFDAGDLNSDGALDVLDIVLLVNVIISENN
jgi:subtilisin family serine protease